MSEKIIAKKGHAGFTLVELMVVVAIVGILAAVSIPNLQKRIQAGRVAAATGDLACIGNALDNYAQANPSSPVPSTLDTYAGLSSVASANGCWIPPEDDPDFGRKKWDPWGDSICFVAPGVWVRCRDLIAQPLGGDNQVLAYEMFIKVQNVHDNFPGRVLLLSSEKGIHQFSLTGAQSYRARFNL